MTVDTSSFDQGFGSDFGIPIPRMKELNDMAIASVKKSEELVNEIPDDLSPTEYERADSEFQSKMKAYCRKDRESLKSMDEAIFYGYLLGSHVAFAATGNWEYLD